MNLLNLKEKSDLLPTLSRYPRPTPVQNAKDHLSAEREQFIYYAYKSKPYSLAANLVENRTLPMPSMH